MKPLDPRLLRHARPARRYVLLTAATGVATTGLVVAQAILIAAILAPAVSTARPLGEAWDLVGWLAAVVAARAGVVHLQERFAHRAATRTIIDLRRQVVTAAVARGPRWLAGGDGPATVTLATRGLEDLEPYFVRYLPQLLLAATLTPATLVVVWWHDWVAGVIILGTIPLVPIFMILVGQLTQGVSDRRLATMQRLGSQVLDLVAGLPTLRALGREKGPAARVRALGDAHRRATMGTLRVAFLSGMVLELLTTLCVAVVAVSVGLRLVDGGFDLQTGLVVIVLAPEVFLPLRQVGLHFHASTDGLAAADAAFAVIESPDARPDHRGTADPFDGGTFAGVRLEGVSVRAPGRGVVAPDHLDLDVVPGRVVALVGPNGAGKSTAVLALLGLEPVDAGTVAVRTTDADGRRTETSLDDLDLAAWHRQVAWVPQRALLTPGTIIDAVRGTTPLTAHEPADGDPSPEELAAARLTGLDDVVATLPAGWRTRVGTGGIGLSLGQRQRVILTRALVDDRPVVVLDEPTAHLDALSEQQVLDAVATMRDAGRAVLVVAHRAALVDLADDVVEVSARSLDARTEVTP
ncbi:thiol reductant ABC exporter subunit CydD [Sanguibacter hominis ATCC BAA-789]|uniref:Thiol reductant ABC exporter subunit CydD n=1 Tax=Sanguibacter hominis ATCC BAA-789 TaxID=1312740 RepID=A0A9X5FB84_9MICO|nr:thiol reductant ABC exporter subunit CydD [Sanguibacter hominis ATCC BAA-789]